LYYIFILQKHCATDNFSVIKLFTGILTAENALLNFYKGRSYFRETGLCSTVKYRYYISYNDIILRKLETP